VQQRPERFMVLSLSAKSIISMKIFGFSDKLKPMQQDRPYLSVIIPAFNEQVRIAESLEKIDQFLSRQNFSSEVIVVDDCSNDFTYDVVRQFISSRPTYRVIRNEENFGKGHSLKRGMAVARGQIRLFSDADLSTPIEEVTNFLEAIKQPNEQNNLDRFDVVIGSRRVQGAKVEVRQPIFREAAGRIFSLLVRASTVRGFIDTQCGFKMFTADAAEKIFPRLTVPGFGFDVELLFIAKRVLGLKVKEAPVVWMDSPLTRVRMVQDSTIMFTDLLRVHWNYFKKRYQ
jgi:dolichyl-phosphate beta-glucosyltransferase